MRRRRGGGRGAAGGGEEGGRESDSRRHVRAADHRGAEDGQGEASREAAEADGFYDDIGGALKIKQLRQEKQELLESLEMYYRVFFLGEDVEEK